MPFSLDSVSTLVPYALGLGGIYVAEKLHLYRRRPRTFLDHLSYERFDPNGNLVLRDGTLLAFWTYRGLDPSTSAEDDLEALAETLNRLCLELPNQVTLQFDYLRQPLEEAALRGTFPHPVPEALLAERAAARVKRPHFETQAVLSLAFNPAADRTQQLEEAMVRRSKAAPDRAEVGRRQFDQLVDTFLAILERTLHLERLAPSAVLQHLFHCVNGRVHQPAIPAEGTRISEILAAEVLTGGLEPQLGDRHLRLVSLDFYPAESTYPTILAALSDLPFPLRWSATLELADPRAEVRKMKHGINWLTQLRDGPSGVLRKASGQLRNPDQLAEELLESGGMVSVAKDLKDAADLYETRVARPARFRSRIVVLDDDEERLADHLDTIREQVARAGFTARILTVNSVLGYFGSLPGHPIQDPRSVSLPSNSIANLLPFSAPFQGVNHAPSKYIGTDQPSLLVTTGSGSTPFHLNCHVQDVGHTLVLGDTGGGKSYVVGHLAEAFLRYPKARVNILDHGLGQYVPCVASGGVHFNVGSPQSPAFQPMRHIDDPDELLWAQEWVAHLLSDASSFDLTTELRRELHEKIALLADMPPASRTFTHLREQCGAALRGPLAAYAAGGPYAGILDGSEDPIPQTHFCVYDLQKLYDRASQVTNAIQLYLAHRLAQLPNSGGPTLLVFEEAGMYFQNPFAERWIRQLLATARKKNIAVVLVAQSPSQLQTAQSKETLQGVQTKILLPDRRAAQGESAAGYQFLGVPQHLLPILETLEPKRDYLAVSPLGARVFNLGKPGPIAELLFSAPAGMTEEKTVEYLEELRSQYPHDWLLRYAEGRGLQLPPDLVSRLQKGAAA